MGYTALYRKFRPKTFDEMVGQEHIKQTLKNQIIADRVGHAYLFNGSRGTGKTSAAKILARAINCLNPQDGEPCNECEICKEAINGSLTDIVEMDAASNNSVDDVRSIREEVNFLPTKAKYRVYIIDEVHMLSTGAFNALLKTLEEPPEHVKFILATTEPQKLPATILSRCQRFDFKRISNEDIVKRLNIVCKESKIEADEKSLNLIAELSEGAMRDALSILERCVQNGESKISQAQIRDLIGIPEMTQINSLVKSVINYDIDSALQTIQEITGEGKDINNLLWETIKYIKDILIIKVNGKAGLYSDAELSDIKELAEAVTKDRAIKLIYDLSELANDIKLSEQKLIMFQAGIIRLCNNDFGDGVKKHQEIKLDSQEKPKKQIKPDENSAISEEKEPVKNEEVKTVKAVQDSNEAEILVRNNNEIKPEEKQQNKSEEFWPKVVSDLKSNGKMLLYTSLKGTVAKEVNDITIEIAGIPKGSKTILEQPENEKVVSDMVSIAKGKEMRIKYVDSSNAQAMPQNDIPDIENFANNLDIPFNIID